jgi:hypothetical protein
LAEPKAESEENCSAFLLAVSKAVLLGCSSGVRKAVLLAVLRGFRMV